NGGSDLDAWTDVGGFFRLNRGHPDFRDSGAVMVGAALSGIVGGSHTRWSSSNFGSRIDCYGWGTNVTTRRPAGGRREVGPAAEAVVAAPR
ncbi:MAG: hypothetical protein QOK16_3086, partial [Solirubrobacteraceae bacterium]|nr:hypothetical protein [Solirubrobacteraceae bacterium]